MLTHILFGDDSITFEGSYRPNTGPLPTLVYPLIGLWRDPRDSNRVIKALFKAGKIPMHGAEPILHRYEGVSHQGHAKYRYFVTPGHAGMVLGPAQLGGDLVGVAHHLTAEAQATAVQGWEDGVQQGVYELLEIPDVLGNFAPIVLCLKKVSLTHETPVA